MAEKSEVVVTLEEKVTQAKELYGRGSRNYLVKSYNEAADDLSQVCKLYEDIYGQISDELGMPYLLYAKSLIALAQDENKVIDVPEEEDQDDEDDDDEEEDDAEENGGDDDKKTAKDEKEAEVTQSSKTEENTKSANGDHKAMEVDKAETKDNEAEAVVTSEDKKAETDEKVSEPVKTVAESTDKESEIVEESKEKKSEAVESKDKEAESTSSKDEKVESKETIEKPEAKTNGNSKVIAAEPGTSNGANTEANDENEDDDEAAANLQVAWEILELAAIIFERQGEKALGKLAEVYGELAGISFENSHFDAAIADFKQSLAIHMKLPDDNRRIIAEIHYKIGLAHLMQNSFDDCIRELKKASELMDEEIEEEKQKENLTEKQKEAIEDLEETKQDILAKITEVEETKQQSIEEVRNELSKLISTQPSSSDGAGPSSSKLNADAGGVSSSSSLSSSSAAAATAADKPKATDISHLIKRKKPDTATPADVESSPAKRPAV